MKTTYIKLPNKQWAHVIYTGEDTEVFIIWSNGKVTTGQHDSGYKDLCNVVSQGLTHDQCTGLVPPGSKSEPYQGYELWKPTK